MSIPYFVILLNKNKHKNNFKNNFNRNISYILAINKNK